MSAFDWRGPSQIADAAPWMRYAAPKPSQKPKVEIVLHNKHTGSINTEKASSADKTHRLRRGSI